MSIQIVEIAQPSVIDTVAVAQPSTVAVVEVRQGPVGPAASGAITSATTSDGTADLLLANVETATAEVTGTLIAPHIHGNLAGSVYAHVRAGEALEKGDPVYVSSSHGSGADLIAEVSKADASNAAKMPAVGIMDADVALHANGHMVIVGTITELDTDGLAINAELYVAAGGGMTATPPTARAQPVARVERANANNGAILVKVNGLSASDATPSTLVRRKSDGGASLNDLTLSGTGGSPFTSTLTGGVNFANRAFTLPDASGTLATVETLANSATITASTAVAVDTIVLRDGAGKITISNSDVSGTTAYANTAAFTYGTGAASAHRTALGLGTGDSPTFANATFSTGSIATSQPLALTQTWTNAAVTYTGLQVNITDSGPSNAASLLADFQVGGSSRFTIGKTGFAFRAATIFAGISSDGAGRILLNSSTSGGARVSGDLQIGLSDTVLTRDAANTLAQRNGTGLQPQAFRLYNTYTSSTNFERLNFRWDSNVAKIGTEKGSAGGTARDLVLETDGTERVRVTAAGAVTIGASISASVGNTYDIGGLTGTKFRDICADRILQVGGGGSIRFEGRSRVGSQSDGLLRVSNSSESDFNRLQLGGTTSSFPAIKRTGSDIEIIKADGTAVDTAIILASPDGTRYRVTVADGGALTTSLA